MLSHNNYVEDTCFENFPSLQCSVNPRMAHTLNYMYILREDRAIDMQGNWKSRQLIWTLIKKIVYEHELLIFERKLYKFAIYNLEKLMAPY